MSNKPIASHDELDLFGVVEFFIQRWRTILLASVIGGALGIGIAYSFPEKYMASAAIEGGKVLGKEVEPVQVLAERMASPSFYSETTLTVCRESNATSSAQATSRMLSPTVQRNSAFVSITAKMMSPESAKRCLEAVLQDVRVNQAALLDLLKTSSQKKLDQLRLELTKNETVRSEEIALYSDQLEVARKRLADLEDFTQKYALNKDNLDVNDEKFSASSLFVALVTAKAQELYNLQEQIVGLESRIRAKVGTPETERILSDLSSKIISDESQLQPPVTVEAGFATPIVTTPYPVEPKKSWIAVSGLGIGAAGGLLLILLQRFFAELVERRK